MHILLGIPPLVLSGYVGVSVRVEVICGYLNLQMEPRLQILGRHSSMQSGDVFLELNP
jgi:hypothetical protein